ncbi:MAG: FIST N-terminal domain-containing protein [Thermoguttaceae bacterium]
MLRIWTLMLTAGMLLAACGCSVEQTTTVTQGDGDAKAVAFGVAWCENEDPAIAAKTAVTEAIEKLGCDPKGLIFYEYYPKTVTVTNDAGDEEEKEIPDAEKDKLVLPAIRGVIDSIPMIGCRARSLVSGGTMLQNTVAVMAIGGTDISCKAIKTELVADRKAVGAAIAEGVKDVADLKLIMALSEMNLSFDTTPGISVEDFIRGALDVVGKDVTLFGGNCMPNDYPDDKGGVQFIDDEVLEGHVVALGIGGPIAVHANHTNEFELSEKTVEVTKTDDKWILELDGRPTAEVYRELRGMKPEDPFTSDSQHPIGVIVTEDESKVYLRMVLEERADDGALRFVAAVPEGTKIKILIGGFDAQAILDSAAEGITESLNKAGDAEPLVAILSDCCARGGRLREFRSAGECEIKDAILPALGDKAGFPIFGFYAWGELGPIAGEFGGLTCMYQQHTFVSAVLTEEE